MVIKEWNKGSKLFTYNYGDFLVQGFETYGTQRWAIDVCGNIDFIYALIVKENMKMKKENYRIWYIHNP